jgi:hypothetical protein
MLVKEMQNKSKQINNETFKYCLFCNLVFTTSKQHHNVCHEINNSVTDISIFKTKYTPWNKQIPHEGITNKFNEWPITYCSLSEFYLIHRTLGELALLLPLVNWLPLYREVGRDISVTERAGTPFQKLFLRMMQAGTTFWNHFFPAIDITRFGVSCYPTALLSNKLAKCPLKFQRVTANNSLDFVQFLEKKNPHRILGHSMRSGTFFFFFFIKIGRYIYIVFIFKISDSSQYESQNFLNTELEC